MTITEFVRMAKRMHDAEEWDLGARSSRETRNAFFERAVGCAHWGHPVYNPLADKQWHCKDPDGPGGRPASDDVIVSMPSRQAYDCIPGAGADGYRFEADHAPFHLPLEQWVFVPSKPDGAGFPEPAIPPVAQPKPKPYPGDAFFTQHVGAVLEADYLEGGQRLNAGAATWFGRTIWKHVNEGMPMDDAVAHTRKEWRAALGLPR